MRKGPVTCLVGSPRIFLKSLRRLMKSAMLGRFATAAARRPLSARRYSTAPAFSYEALFQTEGPLPYPYRKLTSDHVSTIGACRRSSPRLASPRRAPTAPHRARAEVGGKRVLQESPRRCACSRRTR